MKTTSGLENKYGQSVALKSVALNGRLEGLLLTMKISQTYLNDSNENIEASYTFPAGWGANLLGFSVTLQGKHLKAVALAKDQAEAQYEVAVSEGDTPVMLEKSPLGLYTANIGNLKVGDEAVIEIEYAQLLRFEKGRLRITVPTVIGQRYGEAREQGHVAAHQGVDTDPLVDYPFTANLDVLGAAATGVLSCPSHQVTITAIANGQRVALKHGAYMDRDFVVAIDALQGASFACIAHDGDGFAAIASFCPDMGKQPLKDVALKILVDCSGSMQGQSIEQAREALHELSLSLTDQDYVSYSLFGSQVSHTTPQLERFTPRYQRELLAPSILNTEANMGGTELEDALFSTMSLKKGESGSDTCDVLLITDGDVWNIERSVDIAKNSQHRIFAIGVGSAPAESLLRELAEQSGGACELVTPSENMAQAVLRMLQRMRSARSNAVRIDWYGDVRWQSLLPTQVFAGETVHIYAQLDQVPFTPPTLSWQEGETTHSAVVTEYERDEGSTVPRLTAAAKLNTIESPEVATQLAVEYQLASQFTNLLLVHVRKDEDKATGLPSLQKINQMQAAGWGGFGNIPADVRFSMTQHSGVDERASYSISEAAPAVFRTQRTTSDTSQQPLSLGGVDNYEIPAFLRRDTEEVWLDGLKEKLSKPHDADDFSPNDMIETVNALSVTTKNFANITHKLRANVSKGYVWAILCEVKGDNGIEDVYWACLLNWLADNVPGIVGLSRHAKRFTTVLAFTLTPEEKQAAEDKFRAAFHGASTNTWGDIQDKQPKTLGQRLKKIIIGA